MRIKIRPLSKFHLFAKIALFGIFATKFFDHVLTHALKISLQICSKTANFIKQSEFRKRSIDHSGTRLFLANGIIFLLCLTGCVHHRMIVARSEYLDAKYLASSQIETPDPCRACFNGQQVVVSWRVPCYALPADLVFKVRFGNREMEEVIYPLTVPSGFWIYRLMNKDFWAREGICSYSIQICREGMVLDRWDHHLWADIITIDVEPDLESTD